MRCYAVRRVFSSALDAHMQLLPGLIPKIDLVAVFASQVQLAFAGTLLLQNCDLRRSRNPMWSMPPDPRAP